MGRAMQAGSRHRQKGLTYIALLIVVALLGIAASVTGPVVSSELRRAKEAELVRVGRAIERAIGSYYEASPGTAKQWPRRLDDLLLDNRFATVRRHLRTLYLDPFTGAADWVAVRNPEGGIVGVHSASTRSALGRGPLEAPPKEAALTYADWKFIHVPQPTR